MTQNSPFDELKRPLEQAWSPERPHVERITLAAAVISKALQQAGMQSTLVGGGAVEFYAPGAYVTQDIDLVVEGKAREAIDEVLVALGLERRGRHWTRDELFVEVPATVLEDPADVFPVGPFELRVIRKEYILGERIVGFRHWKSTAHAQQAIDMIAAFGDELDMNELRVYLRREGAEEAFDLLRGFARSGAPITATALDELWQRRYRSIDHGDSYGY